LVSYLVMHHRKLDQTGHRTALDLAIHHRFAESHLAVGQHARDSRHGMERDIGSRPRRGAPEITAGPVGKRHLQ